MKFVYARPPQIALNLSEPGRLSMPSTRALQVVMVVLGPLLLGLILAGVALSGNLGALKTLLDANVRQLPLWAFLGGMALICVLHEFVHFIFFPRAWTSDRTLLGCLPGSGLAYAWSGEPMKRNRYILAALAPLTLLSVIPLLGALINPQAFAPLIGPALFNLLGVGGDLITAYFVWRQIPQSSWIQMSGMQLFWSASSPR
jgi:hypothetical protein